MFAYDDVVVVVIDGNGDVADDDTVLFADSSLAAAGVADILSVVRLPILLQLSSLFG